MRAIWKGAVSFGLVSVPVKLYSATESHDVSFRQVHAKDGGRIKYQRVCSIDGEEVAYADIAKGYETEDGEMVILTDDDLAELPSTSCREIAVEKFVPTDQIDPMLFEKSYYLEPEKSGAKPYALLRQALIDADRMAVVTVALRQRTTVAVLRVRDDVIVLQTMMWPDEIRQPDFNDRVRRGQGRRGQDGQHAGRDPRRRLRHQRVRGRLRRGGRGRWSRRRSRAARSRRRRPPPSPPARWSTCWPPSSARSTPPRPPAASPAGRVTTTRPTRRSRPRSPRKKSTAKKTAKKSAKKTATKKKAS